MEEADALGLIAEIGIAIGGFAGVIATSRAPGGRTGAYGATRIGSLLAYSALAVLIALVPFGLHLAGPTSADGLDAFQLCDAVSSNGDDGIDCGNGCTIIGNTSQDNGSDANGHGIECSFGCLVRDNAVRSNAGFGLSLGSGSAYGANVITGNQTGTVSGGNNILLNVCDGPNEPQCP